MTSPQSLGIEPQLVSPSLVPSSLYFSACRDLGAALEWKEPYGHICPGHKGNSHVGIIDNGHTKVAAPLFALSLTESKGHPQKTASSR